MSPGDDLGVATWLNGGGWGTREDAIPGEWALLVLCMVMAALLGVAVFWFTTLRHEQTLRERAERRPSGAETFRMAELVETEPAAESEPESEFDPEPEAESESEPEPDREPEPEPESVPEGEPEPEPEPELEPALESAAEPELEPEPEPEPEPAVMLDSAPEPESEPAFEPASGKTPAKSSRKLTDAMLDRVEVERSRRRSVKWKELAALVAQEFGVQVHPRTIERALKRRKAANSAANSAAVSVAAAPAPSSAESGASDPASA